MEGIENTTAAKHQAKELDKK